MLSVLARQSTCALRSPRPLSAATCLLASVCRRTISTPSELPPRLPTMSQIELRDARDPNTWLHVQTLRKAASDMTAEEAWARREARVSILDPPQSTWSGRSVPVNQQEPLHTAFSRLSKIMNRNNVPRELFLTRRHEKKGVKRRRLVSVRWRRRFAHEVRKKVQLVKEIRARGA